MIRLALAVMMTLQAPGAKFSAPPLTMSAGDIERVKLWIEAMVDHRPGETDASLETVRLWSNDDLRTLWINASVLLARMHEEQGKSFSFSIAGVHIGNSKTNVYTVESDGKTREIHYTADQSRQMRSLACAIAGNVHCVGVPTPGPRAAELQELLRIADRVHESGDQNFVLRRGAMLHADIATGALMPAPATASAAFPAPRQMRLQMFDGLETDRHEVAIHWILGRLLLDAVTPAGKKSPAAGADGFVREWYRATAAWMQKGEDFDTVHVARAVTLFPNDPDLLFLAGCEHEAFASPAIAAAVAVAVPPKDFGFDIGSPRAELDFAEAYFRRALKSQPSMMEARLHLGHVLLEQRRFNDAALMLRDAAQDDGARQYYRWLFLGTAEEGIARYDAAAQAYRRASALQPGTQAPLMASSELAWRRHDIAAVSRELQRLAALSPDPLTRSDPWWTYHTSAGHDADQLLDAVRDRLREPEAAR